MDPVTLSLAKMYTDEVFSGAGTIKGKNCTIKEYRETDNAVIVTFQWTADDGTVQTMDVPISYEKIAEFADVDAKAEFKTLELDIVTTDGVTYSAENLSETFEDLKSYEENGYKLLAVGKLSDGSKICLNLLETSDTKLTFTGCGYKSEAVEIYTIEMTENATSVSIKGVSSGEDELMFITCDVTATDGVYSVQNVSHTFDEMKEAVSDGVVLFTVASFEDGSEVTLPLQKSSDAAYEFAGVGNNDGVMHGYSLIFSDVDAVFSRVAEFEKDVFPISCQVKIFDDGTQDVTLDRSYDEVNDAFYEKKSVVCTMVVTNPDGTEYDVSLYTRSRADGTIVLSGKAAPQSVEMIYTLTLQDTGDKAVKIEETTVGGERHGFTITGKISGLNQIASIDKTFAEIKEAIESAKDVTLLLYMVGKTTDPYVFKPSVVIDDVINFSLVYGSGTLNTFTLMSVDIKSNDTYNLHSQMIDNSKGFNITGQLRGNSEIVSLDKTFAEIKAAIEAKKNVTLFVFADGETENPYVFTLSVVLADTINFSLVNGTGAIDTFEFMSVDIHSDDTYSVNSKLMQKEFVAGDGVKIEPKTIEEESEFGEIITRETLEISSDSIIESPLELPVDAKPNKLYHTYANYDTPEFGALINGEFRRYSGFTAVQTLPTTDIIETNVYLIPGTSWNIYSPTEGKWYTYVYSSAIEVLDFSEIEEPANNTLYRLIKRVYNNKMYKLVDGAWLGYEPEFFPAGTLKMVDNITVHDPDLNIDKTSRQLKGFSVERRDGMPTGGTDDPIEKDILYVDKSKGSTDEEAALLKRYEPNLSSATDGYLRYLPVDSFVKTFDALTLLNGLTASSPAPQGFVIADSLLYLQGYLKTSKTFSSSGWNIISEFDLATIGYEWAGLEEGLPIRTLVSVWNDNAYVNSCISIYNVTGSPSSGNFSFYVTNALVNKAIAFNLNVLLPVRKKR